MRIEAVHQLYFSATGTTKTIVNEVGRCFSKKTSVHELLRGSLEQDLILGADDLLIVGMPVFVGRVPALAVPSLEKLRGDNTPAILVAVYGNRDYEDALLEMKNLLEPRGFIVVAAAAFVAQHSIFPRIAAGRPDAADMEAVRQFAAGCARKLEGFSADGPAVVVKGNFPYREYAVPPLKPGADESCTRCGACAATCPAGAIPEDAPQETDTERCIACGACIVVCPARSRAFRGRQYEETAAVFFRNNSARKEPEIFI